MSQFQAMRELIQRVKEQENIIKKLSQDYVVDAIREAAQDLRASIPRLTAVQWAPCYDVLDFSIKIRTFSGVVAVSPCDLSKQDLLPSTQVNRIYEFYGLLVNLYDQLIHAFGDHEVIINVQDLIMKVGPKEEAENV